MANDVSPRSPQHEPERSSMAVNWKGVFPAATTQFHNDQSLDIKGTTAQVERMLLAGVHGMIMLGTVGENCSLEYREKLDVLRATVEQVSGRVPVLSGVAECSTALACPSSSSRTSTETHSTSQACAGGRSYSSRGARGEDAASTCPGGRYCTKRSLRRASTSSPSHSTRTSRQHDRSTMPPRRRTHRSSIRRTSWLRTSA